MVPLTPGVAVNHPLPALFIRYNVFDEGIYCTTHEFAWLPVAVNHAQTEDRLAAPAVSEYCKAKVCAAPDPEEGVTPTADGVPVAPGTVQVPRACHPPLLAPPASPAHMYTVCVPVYPAVNESAR